MLSRSSAHSTGFGRRRHGQRRSRVDGTLYPAPPRLRMAGPMALLRGRPARVKGKTEADGGLGAAMAGLDAAIAATDRLLG